MLEAACSVCHWQCWAYTPAQPSKLENHEYGTAKRISSLDCLAAALHAVVCRLFHEYLGIPARSNTEYPVEVGQAHSLDLSKAHEYRLQDLLSARQVHCLRPVICKRSF
jgi:hypothetical protein